MNMLVYPAPADLLQPRIRLRARTQAGWVEVPVMRADSISPHPHAHGGCEGWAYCCCTGSSEFEVTFESPIEQFRVRPSLTQRVPFEISGTTARLQLREPRYIVIESGPVRADEPGQVPRYTLYLLVDPPDPDEPQPEAAGVKVLRPGVHEPDAFEPGAAQTVYLLPGVHDVVGQKVDLRPGKTLYLAGGAHLRSYIRGERADGASIRGRGVIDGTGVECKSREWRDDGDAGFVFFRRGSGITIDGPIIYDSPFWNIVTFGTTGTRIRNHKAITWRVNNDGVQPRSCNDLLVERCFLKCADDCIAVKTRRAAGMISRDLVFRDLVLWNDVPGNGVEIGHTSQADLLERVRFEEIDLLHCDSASVNDGFAISISLIDHSTVQGVTYRNFRTEGVRNGDLRLWIGTSRYTTDAERGRIDSIEIDGYLMEGTPHHSRFVGADADHMVTNVHLRRLVSRAGTPQQRTCSSLEDLHAEVEHARSIIVSGGDGKPTGGSAPVDVKKATCGNTGL
jgi:hypothetical protein